MQSQIINNQNSSKYAQLSQQQADEREKNINNCEYDLYFEVDENFIYGTICISFNSDISNIYIDFGGEKITSIQQNGENWSQEMIIEKWQSNQILIQNCKDENKVAIQFVSKFSDDGFGMFKQIIEGNIYIYSLFCPNYAHSCFPCFDQPSIKSKIKLIVVAPPDWKIISNYPVLSKIPLENSTLMWTFQQTPRLSTYLFSLNMGNWRQVDSILDNGINISMYCEQQKYLQLLKNQTQIIKCLKFGFLHYEELFQISYPFEKYDLIFCSNFYFSGMEHPGAILLSQNYLQYELTISIKTSFALLLLHELSHMWFGNLVTMKWWNDLWLNEAFAVYISFRALEIYAKDEEFEDVLIRYLLYKQNGVNQDVSNLSHPIEMTILDANEGLQAFDQITYNKGSAVLCDLVHQVGFNKFNSVINKYLLNYSWQNATTDDLIQLIQQNVENFNTLRWKQEFILTSGINIIELINQNNKYYIKQTSIQNQIIRQHTITILLLYKDKQEIRLIYLDKEYQEIILDNEIEAIILNSDDNCYCIANIDEKSQEFILNKFKFLELSSLTKAHIINSLCQMGYILGSIKISIILNFMLEQIIINQHPELLRFIIDKFYFIFEQLNLINKVNYGIIMFQKLQIILLEDEQNQTIVNCQIGDFAMIPEHIQFLYTYLVDEIGTLKKKPNNAMLTKFLNCLFYKFHIIDEDKYSIYQKLWNQFKQSNKSKAISEQAAKLDKDEIRIFFNQLLKQNINIHILEDNLIGMNNQYSPDYMDYVEIYLTYLPVLINILDTHKIRILLMKGFPVQGDFNRQLQVLQQINNQELSLTLNRIAQSVLLRKRIQESL